MSKPVQIRELPAHRKPIEKKTWKKGEPIEKLKEALRTIDDLVDRRKASLKYLESEYREIGNPYCAWDAFLLSEKWGLPLPPAIRDYFLKGGKKVMKTSQPKDIGFALGFGGPTGPRSLLSQYRRRMALEYAAAQKQFYINTGSFKKKQPEKAHTEGLRAADQAVCDANIRFGTDLESEQVTKHKIFRKK